MNFFERFFNFDDIGKKIKNLVKWYCWITIMLIWIAAPITFIALLFDKYTAFLCWIPLVSAIFGPIFIWISCWGLYAFGELVDKTASGTRDDNDDGTEFESQDYFDIEYEEDDGEDYDEECAEEFGSFIEITCPKCKKKLSVLADETSVVCPWCNTNLEYK